MMEGIEQKMKDALQRYGGSTDSLTSPLVIEQEQGIQKRIVVGIVLGKSSSALVSSKLYRQVSQMKDICQTWIIESLSPLPFISAPVDETTTSKINDFLNLVYAQPGEFCAVFGMDIVEYGIQGSNARMSYGSSGKLVSDILRGCVLLPREYCWGNSVVMNFMKFQSEEKIDVDGNTFYKIVQASSS